MSSSRRQYPFHLIEPKWQQHWEKQQSFRAWNPGETIPSDHPFAQRHGKGTLPPKFYILDMFPYPSGAGLHVGHPEGYTATDILARYRRALGFNVLHPMGWDAFGLPAEQYAVKTGQHPRQTTEANITTFKRQIQSLGFSYDWSREVDTTDPEYFRWTQWIFLQLYNSWFNPETNRAEPIETLRFPEELHVHASNRTPEIEARRRAWRDQHRLAFVSEAPVNWCPELGTVLANEEVIDGKSEVGGFPVIRRPMRQWMLRITDYAERLLADLDTIDWSDSLKEMQRNWIGRSEGAEVDFEIADCGLRIADSQKRIRVFTTRPDTLFGATYMVLSPEHKLLEQILPSAWPENVLPAWKGARPKCSNARPSQSDVKPSQSDAKPSQSEINSTQSEINPSQSEVRPLQSEVNPSQSEINSTRSEIKLPQSDVRPSQSEAEPSQSEINPSQSDVRPLQSGVQVSESDGLFFEENVPKSGFYGPAGGFATPAEAVKAYQAYAAGKSDLERTELAKEKTGVFTGAYAINPVNGEKIPIWIADYVLATYGTGAIMAVPGHDTRDFEFAQKFHLPIVQVVEPPAGKPWQGFTDEGTAVNSIGADISLNGLPTAEAKQIITAWLESKGLGQKTINYKLRDWLFSRQRYWGEPFPIVWKKDAAGNLHHEALPESALPLLPPTLEDYKPTPDGQPPLARATDWVTLLDGSIRETNTMPQWAGSCWYYLRYLDARNAQSFTGKDAENYWMGTAVVEASKREDVETATSAPASTRQRVNASTIPGIDLYVGGTEHAVLHLLYARFWHKVLYDLGHVSTPEPFFKLVNQGLILGEDGQKMSKSRGNVVNPDDVLAEFGADAFRLYEMFMGPLEMVKPWNTQGVSGVYKFLGRVWRLFIDEASETEFEQASVTAAEPTPALLDGLRLHAAIRDVAATPPQLKTLHACIKKVTEDLDHLRFNTAISALMVFVNEAMTWDVKPSGVLRDFVVLLQPFAPHLAEELWVKLTASEISNLKFQIDLPYVPWPKFDPVLLVEDTLEIPVQVNGKLRDVIRVAATATAAELEAAALACEKARPFLEGKTVRKIIVVPKKLVNVVAG